jgi:outer membrane biosynthesis protein TonB
LTLSAFQLTDKTILNGPALPIFRVPVTPPAGRKAGPIDTAMVNALIARRGNVKRAWIESYPNPYFQNNILRAVVQWKFQPNLRDGTFTDTLVVLAVPLNL